MSLAIAESNNYLNLNTKNIVYVTKINYMTKSIMLRYVQAIQLTKLKIALKKNILSRCQYYSMYFINQAIFYV